MSNATVGARPAAPDGDPLVAQITELACAAVRADVRLRGAHAARSDKRRSHATRAGNRSSSLTRTGTVLSGMSSGTRGPRAVRRSRS